jgi:hypothetical protein
VSTSRSGQGVAFLLGPVTPDAVFRMRIRARSRSAALPFSLGFGDDDNARDRRLKTITLGRRWQSAALAWKPGAPVGAAGIYFWHNGGRASFELDSVELERTTSSGRWRSEIPTRLEGSTYAADLRRRRSIEKHYLRSRTDAARLAFEAFESRPLRGIGWDNFPYYAQARLSYGKLASHNEYLRIGAELGLLGLACLALALLAVVTGVRARRFDSLDRTAMAVVVCGALSQLFVNGITFGEASLPLLFGVACLCARPPARERLRARTAGRSAP